MATRTHGNHHRTGLKHCLAALCLLFLLVSTAQAGIAPRIVGGSDAAAGEFPWQVALIADMDEPFQSQFCGASLLTDQWIVTAAHCYDSSEPGVYVVVGFTDLSRAAEAVFAYSESWIVHPDYDDETLDSDVALIYLAEPLDLSGCGENCATITPVSAAQEATVAYAGARALVSGWGNRAASGEPDDWTEELQFAALNIMSCTDTPALYERSDITRNMFCAGVETFDRDSCQGDSGGPIVVANNEGTGYLQAGVVSWGDGCAVNGYPGVYTRLSQYGDWLREQTAGACCALPEEDDESDGDGDGAEEQDPEGDDRETPDAEQPPEADTDKPAPSPQRAVAVSSDSGGAILATLLAVLGMGLRRRASAG